MRGQIQATNDLITINTDMLDILRRQFEKGYVSRLDVAAQEAQLAQVVATLPPLLETVSTATGSARCSFGRLSQPGFAGKV